MKFRKKPITVEAIQYTDPASVDRIIELSGTPNGIKSSPSGLYIMTPEGTMRANKGDWIIRGIRGEIYPCREGIFRDTYEMVEE